MSLRIVAVEGVSRPGCSVIENAGSEGLPTILVHGIFDNVRRWLTEREAQQHGLHLPDFPRRIPMFLPPPEPTPIGLPQLWPGVGLLQRLCEAGRPVVAFSYQDRRVQVADMAAAVDRLHRVVRWLVAERGAERVNLIGHSRGGLVCRHALLCDSAAMSAAAFRSRVDRLITLCTPHRGSRVAEVAVPFSAAFGAFRKLARKENHVAGWMKRLEAGWTGALERLLLNLGQLTADSAEVIFCATDRLPALPGGYFAVAGSSPAYLGFKPPMLPAVSLPPALPVPELTVGQGDLVVSVASALDIPDATPQRTAILPVNHLTAAFTPAVHDAVLRWLEPA